MNNDQKRFIVENVLLDKRIIRRAFPTSTLTKHQNVKAGVSEYSEFEIEQMFQIISDLRDKFGRDYTCFGFLLHEYSTYVSVKSVLGEISPTLYRSVTIWVRQTKAKKAKDPNYVFDVPKNVLDVVNTGVSKLFTDIETVFNNALKG